MSADKIIYAEIGSPEGELLQALFGDPVDVIMAPDWPLDALYIVPSRQSIDIAEAPTTGEVPE